MKGASNDDIRRQNSLAKNGEGKYNEENKSLKGGKRFEDTNTEGMGNGRTDKNNDSIWERSDGSEEIYNSLGGTKKSLRRGKNSGYRYIDWSRIFGDIDVYEQTEKEYAYGVLREISGLDIADVDQQGRTLSEEQKEYFKNTVAKNGKGELIPLYHATDGTTENSNFITSAYGKDNFFNHINEVIEKDALLYASTKKHQSGLRAEGSNCPSWFKP